MLALVVGVTSTTLIYEVRRSITRSTTLQERMNTRDTCVFGRREIAARPRVDSFLFIDTVFTMISRSFPATLTRCVVPTSSAGTFFRRAWRRLYPPHHERSTALAYTHRTHASNVSLTKHANASILRYMMMLLVLRIKHNISPPNPAAPAQHPVVAEAPET